MAFRKVSTSEAPVTSAAPEPDPRLRDEVDPDPMIEEMVERLRGGLSSMVAYDEWGRPLAWRNVVRLAVGAMAGRLRDAETAVGLAAALTEPTPAEAGTAEAGTAEAGAADLPAAEAADTPELTHDVAPDPLTSPHLPGVEQARATGTALDAAAPAVGAAVADAEPVAQVLTEVPAEAVTEASVAPAAEAVAHSQPVVQGSLTAFPTANVGAASVFLGSADQRAVPVRTRGAGELLGGGRTDDSAPA